MADNWEDRAWYDKLVVDGQFGPVTIEACQSFMQGPGGGFYIGYSVDGVWGFYTAREWQRWLQSEGYYLGYNLDGDAGPRTWDAMDSLLFHEGYQPGSGNDAPWHPHYWECPKDGRKRAVAIQRFLNRNRYSRVYSA